MMFMGLRRSRSQRRRSGRFALFFLAFVVTRLSISAVCTPTAATLCLAADDYADIWINGICVLSCAGVDFPYIDGSAATPVKCVSVSTAILDPLGNNNIAVRVRDVQPSEMWGTWALDITCGNGGHSYATIAVTLGEAAEIILTVYNVAGEIVVKKSVPGSYGNNFIEWKGENDLGGRCASGIYLVHAEASLQSRREGVWCNAVIAR